MCGRIKWSIFQWETWEDQEFQENWEDQGVPGESGGLGVSGGRDISMKILPVNTKII